MASDKQPTREDYENAAKRMVEAAVKQLVSNLTVDRSKPVGVAVDGVEPLSADKVVFSWDSVPKPIFTGGTYTMSSQPIGTGIGPYRLPGPPVSPPKHPTYKYSDNTEVTPERLVQIGFTLPDATSGWLSTPDGVTSLLVVTTPWVWCLEVKVGSTRESVPITPPQDMGEVQRLVDALGLRQPTHPSVARVIHLREKVVRQKRGWRKPRGR